MAKLKFKIHNISVRPASDATSLCIGSTNTTPHRQRSATRSTPRTLAAMHTTI
jgi:hypothetical protein